MLKRVCLVGAILFVSSAPALADQSCGNAPLAPAIPSASEFAGKTPDDAHKIVLGALHSVKDYQGTLKSYRDCLVTAANSDKAALADAQAKGDKTKIASVKQQMDDAQKVYDHTVDTETQVVTDYSNLHAAYCNLGSGLTGCPTK
jgi:hypothetical protein